MGSSMGRSVPNTSIVTCISCFGSQPKDDQEDILISNVNKIKKKENIILRIIKRRKKNRPNLIKMFWNNKDANYSKLTSKHRVDSEIQLQDLDVSSLMMSKTMAEASTHAFTSAITNSNQGSCLDLEWEHEYANMHLYNSSETRKKDEDCLKSSESRQSFPSPSYEMMYQKEYNVQAEKRIDSMEASISCDNVYSQNSQSHISTPNSLEWDIDEPQQWELHTEGDDQLDYETLKLLYEIEQLKNRVLNETGDALGEKSIPAMMIT